MVRIGEYDQAFWESLCGARRLGDLGLGVYAPGCNRMGAPPGVMLEQLERFAEGVMPHFAVAERDGG